MKQTALRIIQAAGGFAPFRLANRNKALILTYHRFSQADEPFATSASAFAQHIEYLTRRYQLVGLSELVNIIQHRSTLPPGLAVITIDDGYHDAHDVAFPILKRKRVPATLFAVTGFVDKQCWLWVDRIRHALLNSSRTRLSVEVGGQLIDVRLTDEASRLRAADEINFVLKQLSAEDKERAIGSVSCELAVDLPPLPTENFRPLSWDQLRELDAGGVEVGSHTMSHPILTQVSGDALERELVESREKLEAELGRKVDLFCYPNGDGSPEVERAVAKAGYRAAVTTQPGFNGAAANLLALRRLPAETDIGHFAQNTSGFEEIKNRIVRTRRAAAL